MIDAVDGAVDRARAELDSLVRIPSISADPAHAHDVRASADAVAGLMTESGLRDVRLLAVDGGHPYVVGEWNDAGVDAPTVLLYAHHDVQPPGYVDRWTSDPFVPREAGGRLFGRGTADDKAGAVAHLAAVRAWLDTTGALPCNVKVLVEGEEEIGSPTLGPFLAAHRDALAADVLLLADAGNWSVGTPGLTYSLRGLAGVDVNLRALDSPLHSGMAGGVIPDPVLALATLLATLVDQFGDPAFDGVWDDYQPPGPDERARLAALPTDVDALRRAWGLRPGVMLTGDPTVNLFERLWLRPVVTVIGIDGHPTAGSSNQIVAAAQARISVRVGRGQDPTRLNQALCDHITARVPWGLEATVTPLDEVPAWHCDPTGWAFDAANRALPRRLRTRRGVHGRRGHDSLRRSVRRRVRGHPRALVGPGRSGEPHPR